MKSCADHFNTAPHIWRPILGAEMHYHHGDFSQTDDMETALRAAVSYLGSFIPEGSTVLDVGCGWGGPAKQLIAERKAVVTCLTNAEAQADYCISHGLDVRLVDVETDAIEGHYDVAWFMESLEQMANKLCVLKNMRACADKLIISIGCLNGSAPPILGYGETVLTESEESLFLYLAVAGWKIESIRSRPYACLKTRAEWKRRMLNSYPKLPIEIERLWEITNLSSEQIEAANQASRILDIVCTGVNTES